MSKRTAKLALMMIVLGFVLMFASVPAYAQEPGVDAAGGGEASYFLTAGARPIWAARSAPAW